MRANNLPLNETILWEKAISYEKEVGVYEFNLSNGWLDGWESRFKLEDLNTDVSVDGNVDDGSQEMLDEDELLMKPVPCEVYKSAEWSRTAAFWRKSQTKCKVISKTLAQFIEIAHSPKRNRLKLMYILINIMDIKATVGQRCKTAYFHFFDLFLKNSLSMNSPLLRTKFSGPFRAC